MRRSRLPLAVLFTMLLALQGCLPAPCTKANVTEYLDKQQALLEE